MRFNHSRMLEILFNKVKYRRSSVFNNTRCDESCRYSNSERCNLFFENCRPDNGDYIRCKSCLEVFVNEDE